MTDLQPRAGKTTSDRSEPDYRAYASTLHQQAGRARFAEARDSLDSVARWYEVLARHVDRLRHTLAA